MQLTQGQRCFHDVKLHYMIMPHQHNTPVVCHQQAPHSHPDSHMIYMIQPSAEQCCHNKAVTACNQAAPTFIWAAEGCATNYFIATVLSYKTQEQLHAHDNPNLCSGHLKCTCAHWCAHCQLSTCLMLSGSYTRPWLWPFSREHVSCASATSATRLPSLCLRKMLGKASISAANCTYMAWCCAAVT